MVSFIQIQTTNLIVGLLAVILFLFIKLSVFHNFKFSLSKICRNFVYGRVTDCVLYSIKYILLMCNRTICAFHMYSCTMSYLCPFKISGTFHLSFCSWNNACLLTHSIRINFNKKNAIALFYFTLICIIIFHHTHSLYHIP